MPEPSESQSTPRNTKIAAIEDLIKSTATTPIPGQTPVPTSTPRPLGRRTPRLGIVDAAAEGDAGAVEVSAPVEEIVVDVESDTGLRLPDTSGSGIRRSWLDVALAEKIMAQQRPEQLHLSPGATIPGTRYRIVRWIGDGGMGVVYEAEQMDIGRRFAVKILRQEVCNIPRATQLFRDEARAAAKIGAENIIEIFDFAELPDGRLLYAMELLNGRPLAHEIAARTLSPARVIAILRQVCKGLAAAHAVHIIHRDIKPDNIFLTERQGRWDAVKLLDFGIAIFMVEATVTDANVIGTPHYLAPEIVTGQPYDARVDMYAVGCTAFEMLTGQPPFEGSIKELLEAHVDRPPPSIAELRGDGVVPAELEAVILRCMAKRPDDRFADMDDLEAALCEAQIAAKIETGWDDLPLPNVDVERRDKLLRRMPDPSAGAIASRPRRRPYLAWIALGVIAIGGLIYATNALVTPPPVAVDPQLVRLEAEARDAASRVIFVYPPADDPNARTAYQVILDLEQIGSGARGQAARDLARSLRREFGGTLAAFGDRLWARQGGKEFAVDAYAQALLFDPDIMPAADRARLTPGQLARLADRAETRDFSKDELLASEPLAALAGGGLDAETEELEGVRERLARQVAERKASLDQLTAGHTPRRPESDASASGGRGGGVKAPSDVGPSNGATGAGDTEGDTSGGDAVESAAGASAKTASNVRKRDPAAAAALVEEARAAARRGALNEAERLFERALAADSRSADALAGLTEIHFNRGAYSKAFTYGEKALKLADDDAALHILVGDAAFKVFRYDDARREYQRAEELGHPQAGKRLAKLAAKLGE